MLTEKYVNCCSFHSVKSHSSDIFLYYPYGVYSYNQCTHYTARYDTYHSVPGWDPIGSRNMEVGVCMYIPYRTKKNYRLLLGTAHYSNISQIMELFCQHLETTRVSQFIQPVAYNAGQQPFLVLTLGSSVGSQRILVRLTHSLQGQIKLFGAPRQWKHFRPLFQAVFLWGWWYYPPRLSQTPPLPVPRQK